MAGDPGAEGAAVTPAPSGPDPVAALGGGPAGYDQTMRSLTRGTTVMIGATFSVVILQFLTRVIVTRNVTLTQWGEFNLGLALASLLALLVAFGIPTATARSMAFEQTYEARRGLIRQALLVSGPVAVASSIIVYLLAPELATPFHTAGLDQVFRLFALSIGLTMFSNVLVGIFQGLERAEPYALFIQIVNPALFLILTEALVLGQLGFAGVLDAYVLSWVVACAGLILYSYRRLPPLLRHLSGEQFTGDASARVGFVALSVTLFGVATLTYLTSYADTLLLGFFRPESIVGEYSSSMNLTRLLLVGTGTVTYIYLPITSRLRRQKDFAGLRETYVTVTRWMALLTIPLSFVFFFYPKFSLAFTFGPNQVGGAGALTILVVANTIAILLGPSVATLGGLGETRWVLYFTVISTVANVALCFLLIPPYGIIGAAVAWSVARLVFPGLALIRIYAEHGISPFKSHFLKPILLSTLIVVPVYAILIPRASELLLPFLLVFPLLVFIAAILATRSVDRGDIHFVRSAEARLGRVITPIRRVLESRCDFELPARMGPGPRRQP